MVQKRDGILISEDWGFWTDVEEASIHPDLPRVLQVLEEEIQGGRSLPRVFGEEVGSRQVSGGGREVASDQGRG